MKESYIEKIVQRKKEVDVTIDGETYTLPYNSTQRMMRLGRIRENDTILYDVKKGNLTTLAIKLPL